MYGRTVGVKRAKPFTESCGGVIIRTWFVCGKYLVRIKQGELLTYFQSFLKNNTEINHDSFNPYPSQSDTFKHSITRHVLVRSHKWIEKPIKYVCIIDVDIIHRLVTTYTLRPPSSPSPHPTVAHGNLTGPRIFLTTEVAKRDITKFQTFPDIHYLQLLA
jgi:hypothetical protein